MSCTRTVYAAAALTLTMAAEASGQAPSDLAALVAAAREHAVEVRAAEARVHQAAEERGVDEAALWPTLGVTGSYTRYQRPSVVQIPNGAGGFDEATIVAENQLDLVARVEVPIIDVPAWQQLGVSATRLDATVAARDAARLATDEAVVRAWTELVGNAALVASAEAAVATAERARAVVVTRREAGFGDDAALPRADAELARAQQSVADARLAVLNARRRLRTLTGREAPAQPPPLATDLSEPAPLDRWLGEVEALPAVRAATLEAEAAQQAASAAWLAYVPRLDAAFQERVTNAGGFGEPATWSLSVTLTWRLDRASWALADRLASTAGVAGVEIDRAREEAEDRIVDTWRRLDALRERAEAAIAEATAQAQALKVVEVRFGAGEATQLDVITAGRDVLAAQAGRIQALSELFFARMQLRIAAGVPLTGEGPR